MRSGRQRALVTAAIWIVLTGQLASLTIAADGRADMAPKKLAEQLSAMGMVELLDAYQNQLDDPDTARYLLVHSKIIRSVGADLSMEDRIKLLDEVTAVLEQLDHRSEDTSQPQELLEHFRITFELIEAIALRSAGSYAVRLMYLQGGQAERRMLIALIGKIATPLAKLERRMDRTIEDWRADLMKLVTVYPELETLRDVVRYKSAWIRFYNAIAIPDGSEKDTLLRIALSDAEKFTRSDNDPAVLYWAQLLMGMCSRELKDHHNAGEQLKGVFNSNAKVEMRVQAFFEITRNLIEWGRFELGSQAVPYFRTQGLKLIGSDGELEIDVKATLLEHYLHLRWATADIEVQAGENHTLIAQQVLLKFLRKYQDEAEIRSSFLEILASKNHGRNDYESLDSVTLLAMATQQVPPRPNESQIGAEQLLQMILDRDDAVSISIKPDAILSLAMHAYARRLNLQAGRWFMKLAEEFSDHKLAPQSARNAVYILNGLIEAHRNDRVLIAPNLRREFIKALEILLGKWGRTEDFSKWYFDLGTQYQQLAGDYDYELMSKALKAYQRVPAELSESMEARYMALKFRVKLLDGPQHLRGDPIVLVSSLDEYSRETVTSAQKIQDQSRIRRRRELGAMASFMAAKVLYERLASKIEAMDRLKYLTEQFQDTEVLPSIWEFEIGKLLEGGETLIAIERLKAFEKRYPRKAQALIKLVVQQIRKHLDQVQGDIEKTEELNAYRTAFHRFAEQIYQDALAQGASAEKMYQAEQMRAGAMLAVGKAADALKLFEKCAAYDAKLREADQRQIDEEIAQKLKLIVKAQNSVDLSKGLAEECFVMLRNEGLSIQHFSEAMHLKAAIEFLDRSESVSQQRQRLAVVSEKLIESFKVLGKLRKQKLSLNADTVFGLARAHRALKHYKGDGALKFYNDLVEGIDRSLYPKLYWSVQWERCQCLLVAFSLDKSQMQRLVVLIRQLRLADPAMGGLIERFNAIETKAATLAK